MTETILHESNQVFINPADVNLAIFVFRLLLLQDFAIFGFLRHQAVDGGNGQLHNFKVGLFVMATYVVHFTFHTFANHQVDSFAMVFHIKPVAHVAAVAVDRKFLSFQNILDDKRDQLFGEVIRAVVIGTAGNGHRHFIGIMVSHNHHVGAGLGSTVRAMRTKRGLLRKVAVGTQRTVHLIRRHLMVAHPLTPGRIAILILTRHPGTASCIQQVLRTQNISNEEELRILNATVYVTLGSKVHHVVEFKFGKQFVGKYPVADVTFYKETAFVINVFSDGSKVSGIG